MCVPEMFKHVLKDRYRLYQSKETAFRNHFALLMASFGISVFICVVKTMNTCLLQIKCKTSTQTK